jgi:hypothetical protein
MTPIDLSSQVLAGLSQYKLYQVSRMEDGRRRYRLRLGFFTTVTLAEDVLASVRARYATAFTSCLCEEDLKHATGYLKCSIKDLERTGRYAVQKLRGDSGGTTALRVLTPEAIKQLQAAEVPVEPIRSASVPVKSATPVVSVLPIRMPAPERPAPPPRSATPTTPVPAPVAERRQPGSPLRSAPVFKPEATASQPARADQTQSLKALIMTPEAAPKRGSLMRQAHAMAPMDAVERAKAVPGNTVSAFIDTVTTGKFKAAAANTPSNVAPAVSRPVPPTPTVQAAAAPKTAPQITPPTPKSAPQMAPTTNKAAAPKVVADKGGLEAHVPPPHVASAPIQKGNQAFHVGAGVSIPETSLSLAPSTPATTRAATQIAPVIAPSIAAASPPTTSITDDLLHARALAKQSMQWRQDAGEIPTLDTTQTLRTLTKSELEDTNRPKWFTVQLAISDHPANLDTMPKLDIFDAYSLYSVAVMEGTGIRHALRLGFFREEVSAMAVMGYLKTFFGEPLIVRIPDAEHDRFIDTPKLSALTKPTANHVMLDDKHAAKHMPVTGNVPTISAAVERTPAMTKPSMRTTTPQSRPMARAAVPATKRATEPSQTSKKPASHHAKPAHTPQQDMLDEAALLGLTDTQILRVRKNPSLLSRLVGKLGK